ncbi:MAG: S-layer homology domain-containing protein, partial [Vallitaleaceae bacterium]|nr:S-layer homology domain-containing protein [Vallitaleaceae bacterium]
EAVITARNYGLISGYDDNSFKPNKHITREEAMVMIANAIQLINSDASISGSLAEIQLSQFSDATSISDWAKDKLALVVSQGIAGGANGQIRAKDHITRAEVVKLIYTMLEEAGLL